jgi:hypothetical protein
MKKIIGLFLIFFSVNGYCQWELSSTSRDGLISTYIDFKRIKKIGPNLRVWTLIDLKQSSNEVMSYLALDDWNCSEGKRKSIQISTYSNNMARGNPLHTTEGDGKWVYLTPGSMQDEIYSKICK